MTTAFSTVIKAEAIKIASAIVISNELKNTKHAQLARYNMSMLPPEVLEDIKKLEQKEKRKKFFKTLLLVGGIGGLGYFGIKHLSGKAEALKEARRMAALQTGLIGLPVLGLGGAGLYMALKNRGSGRPTTGNAGSSSGSSTTTDTPARPPRPQRQREPRKWMAQPRTPDSTATDSSSGILDFVDSDWRGFGSSGGDTRSGTSGSSSTRGSWLDRLLVRAAERAASGGESESSSVDWEKMLPGLAVGGGGILTLYGINKLLKFLKGKALKIGNPFKWIPNP